MSSPSDNCCDNDVSLPSTSSIVTKKRKISYEQKYKADWEKDMKWLAPSKKGSFFAWCKSCDSDVKITHGKTDLIRHSETAKHKKSSVSVSGQQTISTMFSKQTKELNVEAKAKEAEIRFAGFIAEHNLPFKLMDHLPDLISATCSDSLIAKKIKCGPTKIKSVITNVTGVTERDRIVALMQNNKFSIIADESTDRSCSKNLCLVARINCNNETVKDYFVALIPVQEATGAALYGHLMTFFKNNNIPYLNNLIGFASDAANNMVGVQNSVVSRLKEINPNIFVIKCICHSFHLCASYACETLPQEVEKFTRDVYNYFANSPKRLGELKEFQEFANVSPVKILHPSATRWLSLENVVKRLLDQYDALTLYFTDQNILQAISILRMIQYPQTKLYLQFLSYILPFFNSLNLLMQSEKPKIHIIYKEVFLIVKTILECYIKDDILKRSNVYDIDFKNPHNFLSFENMYFGSAINNSTCEESVLIEIKKNCLNFYIESIKQILTRFPLKNSVFANFEFLDPVVVENKKLKSISTISIHFPNLIPNNEIQNIDNEWRILRNLNLKDLNIDVDSNNVIEFWTKISKIKLGNNEQRFPMLTNLAFNLLCLPHSSANVERIFSIINLNKSLTRNRLKGDTLEGILFTKSLVSNSGNCYNFNIGQELQKKMKSNILYSYSKTQHQKDVVLAPNDSDSDST